MKKTLFFLLSIMLCWSTSFAAERGIKRIEIKTVSGETVGLYEESHALVIGVSNYIGKERDIKNKKCYYPFNRKLEYSSP